MCVNATDCNIRYAYYKQHSEVNYINTNGQLIQILTDSNFYAQNCMFNEYIHVDYSKNVTLYDVWTKTHQNFYNFTNANVFNSFTNTYITFHTR
jgi:hypothetical protein